MGALILFIIAGALLVLLLLVGAALITLRHDWEWTHRFGPPMLVAGLIGTAIALGQVAAQIELHEASDRAQEVSRQLQQRQELLMQLNLTHDLHGISLAHRDLRGVYLRGKNLAHADLEDTNLSEADLEETNLNGANLDHAIIRNANLAGASVLKPELAGADFTGSDFSRAHVELFTYPIAIADQVTLNKAIFAEASGSIAIEGKAKGAYFVQFSGSLVFWFSQLQGITIAESQIKPQAWICWSNMERARLAGDFTGAIFEGADLKGSSILNSSSFTLAEFRSANLEGVTTLSRLKVRYPERPLGVKVDEEAFPGVPNGSPSFAGARYDAETVGWRLIQQQGGVLWSRLPHGESCELTKSGVPGHPARSGSH